MFINIRNKFFIRLIFYFFACLVLIFFLNFDFISLVQAKTKELFSFTSPDKNIYVPGNKSLQLLIDYCQNPPWKNMEELNYQVSWLNIKIGFVKITSKKVFSKGKDNYVIFQIKAWTNDFFSTFYTVDDTIKTMFNLTHCLPISYTGKIREGSYNKKRNIIFQHKLRIALETGKKYTLFPGAQNPLSCLMLFRILRFAPEQKIALTVFANKRNYIINAKVGKVKNLITPYGSFNCFSIEPRLSIRHRDIEKENHLKIWFTASTERVPIRIESKIKLGKLTADLFLK